MKNISSNPSTLLPRNAREQPNLGAVNTLRKSDIITFITLGLCAKPRVDKQWESDETCYWAAKMNGRVRSAFCYSYAEMLQLCKERSITVITFSLMPHCNNPGKLEMTYYIIRYNTNQNFVSSFLQPSLRHLLLRGKPNGFQTVTNQKHTKPLERYANRSDKSSERVSSILIKQ